MSRAVLCLVAVIFPVWARPAPAQTPPSQLARDTPAAAAGSTATIRGRVVDAATERPLSRVEIRAGSNADQANGRRVLTDGEGRYEIKGLPAGVYTIIAAKPNYVRTTWGEQRVEGPGKRITLAAGEELDAIDLRLVRAGVITGRILDEAGDPVTGAQVTPMRYQYPQGSRRLTPAGRSGQTNDIGEYRIYGLSPGQYYVSATLPNFTMTDQDTTDRSGYASTLFPGTANVAEAQRLTIAAGQTMNGINLRLLPIHTARVSGIALDAQGRPLAYAMVSATQGFGFSDFGGPRAQTRSDGKFAINGLTPGEYSLSVNSPGGQETATATVTVDGTDVNVQLIATKRSTIRGRVTFERDGTPPPASSIHITALRSDFMINGGANVTVKDDMTFEMTVAAGRVFVRSPPTSPDWRLNRVRLDGADVTDAGIDVPVNGSLSDVVVELTNHLYPLSGRVFDGDGAIVRDCFVIVFAQDPATWTLGPRILTAGRPGLDDVFHARMPAGDYYAVAITEVDPGAWTDPEFLSQVRDRATKLTLAAGETKTIDLPLSPPPVF
jgi:protocatechuate 3,4-dioxygenase beta subunit